MGTERQPGSAAEANRARSRKFAMCTACHASCSLVVEFENDEPIKIYGNKDNPISHGYSCVRGRELYNYTRLPSRLTHSLARQPDGSLRPLATDRALREIGDRLNAIIAEYGPRAVAGYSGTCGWHVAPFMMSFLNGIGSPMYFNCAAIDQPGKMIAAALHGTWLGGKPHASEVECAMLVGCNPIVSLMAPFGLAAAYTLKKARAGGMKVIVVDPRRTETAAQSDHFLQPRPGQDFVVLAGMIRFILANDLHDRAFVDAEAEGLDALGQAVSPFTPDYVEARADVPAVALEAAARAYASARTGYIFCSTGPNMAGRGTLTEYLARVLMTLAGHFARPGDRLGNPGVLYDTPPPIAATSGPVPANGFGERLRLHELTNSVAGMPTSVLPDEILMEGDGKVRALIVAGGNPMLAFPDQIKTFEAMKALDLLICIDPHVSATAEIADYVIAPKLSLEADQVAAPWESYGRVGSVFGFDDPYQIYAPAVIPPPPGSDLIEDWEFFYKVMKYMGRQMRLEPASSFDPESAAAQATALDMERTPTTAEILAILFKTSPVPFDRVRREAEGGRIFDVEPKIVQPKPADWTGRFQLADASMMGELAEVAGEKVVRPADGDFLMISRRLKDVFNSCWQEHEPLLRKWRYNPAFFHPDDLAALGIGEDEIVQIESERSRILGVAAADPGIKRGCVSIPHSWGKNPDKTLDPWQGANTGRLCDNEKGEPISWIPRMSALPVRVSKAEQSALDPVR